jgi:hypothetical protein
MASLTDLAIRYSSDKYYSHSYVPFYQELFAGRNVRRLLELGIGYRDLMVPFLPADVPYVHGSSLYMWRDFFPEADIFACDIRPETLINEGRIRSMVCDQSSGNSLAEMVFEFTNGMKDGFDCIIDDGSHVTAHQIFTAECLLPRLNTPGLYVIEDVQDPDAIFWRLMPITRRWPIREICDPIQVRHFEKRPDDTLVVIQK